MTLSKRPVIETTIGPGEKWSFLRTPRAGVALVADDVFWCATARQQHDKDQQDIAARTKIKSSEGLVTTLESAEDHSNLGLRLVEREVDEREQSLRYAL